MDPDPARPPSRRFRSPIEDAQLTELVNRFGGKQWARIALMLPGRTGKQCRERWCNNLDPTLKKGAWTAEEDAIILQLHAALGTRWAEIAKSLPGRSDNSVKNRWYSTCSRILRQQQEAAGGDGPLPNFPNLNADGSRAAPPAPLELGLQVGASRPTTPNLSHSSSCNSLSSRGGSGRKRSTVPIHTPSPKRGKAMADAAAAAGGRWAHPQADLKGPVAEESEHLHWLSGDGESPLMCAEQL
jgi:myb proto-oncogene protein